MLCSVKVKQFFTLTFLFVFIWSMQHQTRRSSDLALRKYWLQLIFLFVLSEPSYQAHVHPDLWSFDRTVRTIWIPFLIHCHCTVKITVLCCHLTRLRKAVLIPLRKLQSDLLHEMPDLCKLRQVLPAAAMVIYLFTTFVYTILEIWRPIVLYVNVGEFSVCPQIVPYGTRPSLINAWNPLQIPSASPSRSCNNFSYFFF